MFGVKNISWQNDNEHHHHVIEATLEDLQHENFEEFIHQHEVMGYEVGYLKIVAPSKFWKDVQLPDQVTNRKLKLPMIQKMCQKESKKIKVRMKTEKISIPYYLQCEVASVGSSVGVFQKMAENNDSNRALLSQLLDEPDEPEMDEKFWTDAPMSEPIYAEHVEGSRCSLDSIYWSLPKLNTLLQRVCSYMGIVVPGLNTPHLFYGQWLTKFCWHVEDLMLFSINFLHNGADKTWYIIPPIYRKKFVQLIKKLCPDQFDGKKGRKGCKNFINHKTLLFNPSDLRKLGIPYREVIQKEGEIIITFPGAYKCGFNHGFNCSEAVNFAMPSWILFGLEAKICRHNGQNNLINFSKDMRRLATYFEERLKEKLMRVQFDRIRQEAMRDQECFEKTSTAIPIPEIEKERDEPKISSVYKETALQNNQNSLMAPLHISACQPVVRIQRIKVVRKENNHYAIDEEPPMQKRRKESPIIPLSAEEEQFFHSFLPPSFASPHYGSDSGESSRSKLLDWNILGSSLASTPAYDGTTAAGDSSFGSQNMNGRGRFACDTCGKVYSWKRNLDYHVRTKHGGEVNENFWGGPFAVSTSSPLPTCPECGKTLSCRRNVNRHLIQVHKQPPMSY